MYDTNKNPIIIYLLFLDSQNFFLTPFLKKGFGHVTLAIENKETNQVLIMDTSATSLNCFWMEKKAWLRRLQLVRNQKIGSWVKVKRYLNKKKMFFPIRFVPGCTAIANHALGFSNLTTLTPWRVYKKLWCIRNRRDMKKHGIFDIEFPGRIRT